MSKDLNNNERYLKQLSDSYKPEPPAMAWDEIEQVLDKDKGKNRLFPFIWSLSVFLLGAIMFATLISKKDMDTLVADQEEIKSDYQKQSNLHTKDIASPEQAIDELEQAQLANNPHTCLLYTSPSPRDS